MATCGDNGILGYLFDANGTSTGMIRLVVVVHFQKEVDR